MDSIEAQGQPLGVPIIPTNSPIQCRWRALAMLDLLKHERPHSVPKESDMAGMADSTSPLQNTFKTDTQAGSLKGVASDASRTFNVTRVHYEAETVDRCRAGIHARLCGKARLARI